MNEREILPGVRAFDHTADLAIEIEAASLAQLFDRAAAGMFLLIEGEEDTGIESEWHSAPLRERSEAGGLAVREVAAQAPDLPLLLVAWLRELLYLHEAEGLMYRGAEFRELEPEALRARVRCEVVDRAVREIKGVTYHGLDVSSNADWHACVVFDV